jgi:superfamily II DNA or RNA helicase
LELRPYQKEAVEACISDIEEGKNPLLVMATGTGKTIIFAHIIDYFLVRRQKSLVIAHRDELINQAIEKIYAVTDSLPEKEKASFRSSLGADVVVASIQTLKNRMRKWPAFHFKLVTVDEAHHATAKSYRAVIDYMQSSVLGVTATPDRTDSKQLGQVFNKISYEYHLDRAIKDGWLSPIVGKRVKNFDIDLSPLRVIRGDFSDEELGAVIENHIAPIAESIVKETSHLKTLVFCPSVKSSQLMARVLCDMGIDAAYLSGGTLEDDRQSILYQFKQGKISHLCSCNILLEGYDEPSVGAIVMCRPTGSRVVYAQAIGRGTRLYPGKEHLLLLEFTYNSSRLNLVTAYELFAKRGFDEKVRKQAEARGEKQEYTNFLLDLESISKYFFNTKEILERMVKREYHYTVFDPFETGNLLGLDMTGEFDIQYQGRKIEGAITKKQEELLYKFGMANVQELDRAQASAMITALFEKNIYPTTKPATDNQKGFLRRRGVNPEGMTMAQASLLISTLKEKRDDNIQADMGRPALIPG